MGLVGAEWGLNQFAPTKLKFELKWKSLFAFKMFVGMLKIEVVAQ